MNKRLEREIYKTNCENKKMMSIIQMQKNYLDELNYDYSKVLSDLQDSKLNAINSKYLSIIYAFHR